ncbi:looped-hinge helix DNA binding domain-containing protein, AbrB family [Halorubrum xinjiangense]|uniref:Looped-hinge helix DNA binding domain-containing protein, AbrB family n=1 Tax=Halorubrum xinjiangense TaxID=261291 RepID=A0A1G7Q750_9EURY|nr:AbrB/MazE/SpoVT family DNA-binding domain-containing protein [Halorubrum xinjiangense]SDF94351.1 looped-hinge helix DNA binding domain-containing protein, AbrB family [Halorubrum xinjiangense]
MSDSHDATVFTVTSQGEVTIPQDFREKLNIDTPGRVRFIETEEGEVVIQSVKRPSDIRGGLASESEKEERSATMELCDERDRDKQKTDEKGGLSEQDR